MDKITRLLDFPHGARRAVLEFRRDMIADWVIPVTSPSRVRPYFSNPQNKPMKSRHCILTALAVFALLSPFTASAQDAKPKGGKQAAAFAAADKDSDDKFNLDEYTEFSKARQDTEAAKAKFTELDKDKDGFLTKEELRADMKGKGGKGGKGGKKGEQETKPAKDEKTSD
jgi:hypothetical protein